MRREGSAFQGLGVVTLKELADHLTSIRLFVLELLVMVIALVTVYLATEQISVMDRDRCIREACLEREPPMRRRSRA